MRLRGGRSLRRSVVDRVGERPRGRCWTNDPATDQSCCSWVAVPNSLFRKSVQAATFRSEIFAWRFLRAGGAVSLPQRDFCGGMLAAIFLQRDCWRGRASSASTMASLGVAKRPLEPDL